jgi:hypothetical protein
VPGPSAIAATGSCKIHPVLGLTGPPDHTTVSAVPPHSISRLSSSSTAVIGLGWLITSPNDPWSLCSIISTTDRAKLGSAS